MKKLENVLAGVFPLCVLLGLRVGYCALFGAGATPAPNFEHSLYRYQPPINGNRPLSINYSFPASLATQSGSTGSPATAQPKQNSEERPLCEKGRPATGPRKTAPPPESPRPLDFPTGGLLVFLGGVTFFLSYAVLPGVKSWFSRIAILSAVWGVAFLVTLCYWEVASESHRCRGPLEYQGTFTTAK